MFCKRALFADDLQIYLQSILDDIHNSINKVTSDASAIVNWSRNNGLPLNLFKIKAIVFGSDSNLKIFDAMQINHININGVNIPLVKTVKSLGITLSSNLSWQAQVNNLTRKVNGTLFRLRYHSDILSIDLRKTLVSSLIFPIFDYCCVLMTDITKDQNMKIERLMNRTIRFIFKLRRDAHITLYRNRLSWLKIESRRKYFTAICIYQLMHIYTPPSLAEFMTPIRRQK